MRRDFAVRGHDVLKFDDLDQFGRELQHLKVHSLAYSPGKSLPVTTRNGTTVNVGLANYVRRRLAQYDAEIVTLSCYVNMIHPNKPEQTKLIAQLAHYLQLAPMFGTRIVATETGSLDPTFVFTKNNFGSAPFKTLIKNVQTLLPVAHDSGTYLALEPGINHPLWSLDRVADLIQAVGEDPNLKLIIDPANLVLSGTDQPEQILQEALQRFGERIVAIHLKDFRWVSEAAHRIETVVPGQGVVDVPALIRLVDRWQPYGIKCFDELPDGKLEQTLALPWISEGSSLS
ncbi:sugar phosphate isomerase/epimerase family protein [Lacticaseibacillus camelliae]|nr:sugar phosphate isomerase/epimerase family protein [Lacticaseibacillus camelliae]